MRQFLKQLALGFSPVQKLIGHRFGWLLNLALNFAMTKFSSATTPGVEAEPLRVAAEYLEELAVEERFFG